MASPPTHLARAAAGALFGAVARVRGDRPLHPAGVAFAGELVVEEATLPAADLFARAGRHRAVARFSRGFGLPEAVPDILSVAIRVPDAYGPGRDQDFMLTATGERPLLRRVFAAGRSHLARTYSSVFPFTVGDETVLLGAQPRTPTRGEGGGLGELRASARAGELALDLRVATPGGSWRTVGRVELHEPLAAAEEDGLAFNSSNAGGGIAPAGFVNAVRDAAYDAAARGRGA